MVLFCVTWHYSTSYSTVLFSTIYRFKVSTSQCTVCVLVKMFAPFTTSPFFDWSKGATLSFNRKKNFCVFSFRIYSMTQHYCLLRFKSVMLFYSAAAQRNNKMQSKLPNHIGFLSTLKNI